MLVGRGGMGCELRKKGGGRGYGIGGNWGGGRGGRGCVLLRLMMI